MYIHTYIYIYIYIYICPLDARLNDPRADLAVLLGWHYGRFPKFDRVCLGRDPGTLKSDIVSKKHPQLICSDLRLSN